MSGELAVIGADTANQQAGGNSFFDNAQMFTGAAVTSGMFSIYNTFVDYGNKFGGDFEHLDTGRVLENYDRNWYNYYKDNQENADVTGFVAGMLVPGTLAIKGLKALQVARGTGAIGRAVSGSLNYFNASRDAALTKGLSEIATEGGSAYAYINANKLAAIGWGVAENVLQGAAMEGAIALTMNASPLLADKSKADLFSDMGFGMLVGGGFGGALDAIVTNRVFKDAVLKVAGKQRTYDTPAYYSNLGLGTGDEVYGFVDSLFSLPKTVQESDKFAEVTSPFTKQPIKLSIEAQMKKTLSSTEQEAFDNIKATVQKLGTDTTPEVGEAFSSYLLKMVQDGISSGRSAEEIKQSVGDVFLGFKKARTLTDDAPIARDDIFYIKHEVELKGSETVDDLMSSAFNRKPFDKNATARPYEVVGDQSAAKVTSTATSFEEAWTAGNDMAIIGGKLRINPKSEIFRQVKDPNLVPTRYFNTRTGGASDDVVATWADMLPKGIEAKKSILDEGVLNGKKVLSLADESDLSDAYTATARHAWASTLQPKYFTNAVVPSNDISKLEVLSKMGKEQLAELNVRIEDVGDLLRRPAHEVDISRMLSDAKIAKMEQLLNDGVTDMREIGYVLNAPDSWMERVIANGFTRTTEESLLDGMSNELAGYLRRENFIATWASPRKLVDLGLVEKETMDATEQAAASKGAKYVDTFVTGELGFQQRVALTEGTTKSAFGAVFDEDAQRFLDVDVRNAIKMADELGVGAGALSSSNANYGDVLKLWSQHTGKLTHQLIQKVANANLEKLQPYRAIFEDNKAAGAELGVVLTMLRRSSNKFVLAVDDKGIEQLVVREVTAVDKTTGIRQIHGEKLDSWLKQHETTGINGAAERAVFPVENKEVLDFLHTWKDINGDRINKRMVLMNSRGATLGWDPEVIYAPPINTQKYPYFAFVKIREGHIAGNSDVGMLTARSAEELSKLSREIDTDKYDIFFKKDTEKYFKIKNEYEAGLSLNEPRVDSSLRKAGKLGDFFYEVRPENVLEDFATYSNNADAALVRHGVDTRYAQLITELNALGKQYTEVATSQMSGLAKQYDRSAINPFGDYVRTALDISKRSSFPLVHQLNEFVDSLGTAGYRAFIANTDKAKKGLVTWQEAERLASKYGIGGVYNADNVETAFAVANRPMDRNIIREAVSKVNSFLATTGLRLDVANSLVNVLSMPIMLGTELSSLKSLAKTNPEAIGELSKLYSTNVDGIAAPSVLKLVGNAIKNVTGDSGKLLIEGYRKTGDVKNVMLQFHEMMGDLAIQPKMLPKEWSKKIDGWIEKGATWTGNNWAEDFTRAVSANVMDQLTAPLVTRKLLTSQEAEAYRSVFVNRVNGNYIASQRPILFQGTVGAAISLFQTYVFNIMQQMTRHIENRDLRTLLTMGGLQGSLYGLNGIPFFDAVNTHLIGNANINDGHRDIYSVTTQMAGKDLGDWMLYGTASAFPLFGSSSPALYSRGDINPRHISILPISPLDIPAVDVSRRIVSNLFDIGSKLVKGGDVGATLLEGLEHNGVSRPLAGFAQLANGYTSTSKGSLISSSNDFDATVSATRMLGAKPMDEAVALNTMYRLKAYQAADIERLSKLGEAVKTKLRKGQTPEPEEMQNFMKQYASAGGNLQNYSSALQRWSRDANMSVVNQLKTFHQSSYAMRMSEVMSGTSLSDYYNAPPANQMPAQ